MIESKNIEIPWMPNIKNDWDIVTGKRIFSSIKNINKDLSENNRLSLTLNGVIRRGINDSSGLNPTDFSTYQIFEENNLVFKLIDLANINTSRVGIVPEKGIMSSAYIRLIPESKTFSKFYYYLYYNWYQEHIFNFLGNGVRATLSSKDLLNLKVPFPPYQEQVDIANYLDTQTKKIKTFISKKQTFISLLKEQRQSVIDNAVTKGGIDWKSKRLKYISDLRFSNVNKHTVEDKKIVRLCNYTDVYKNDYIINDMSLMLASASDNEIDKFTVLKGDILITKDSETAEDIAVPTYVSEDLDNVVCGYHLAMIRADEEQILGEYLYRTFQSKKVNSHFKVRATGVTRVGLSLGDITGVYIPFPKKIEEQIQIINHIKTETNKIDQAISKAEKEIELIQEYQKVMIAEAILGKVKKIKTI